MNAGNVGINVGVAAPMAFFPFSGWRRASSATCTRRDATASSSTPQTKVVVERWPQGLEPEVLTREIMAKLMVGNAPCSWGTLEFDEAKGEQIQFGRMLDELAEAGYTGTELGDWGYMPTDPAALRAELDKRGLVMLGAFVPVALKHASAHAGRRRQRGEDRTIAGRCGDESLRPILFWRMTTGRCPNEPAWRASHTGSGT